MGLRKRRVLEIGLETLTMAQLGRRSGKAANHVLVARLIWPRPAIAEKTSVKKIEFANGKAVLRKEDWAQGVLFKETVQGPCGLELMVTRAVSDSQAARFMHYLYSSVLTALSSEVGVGTPGAWFGLLRHPLRFAAREASKPPKDWPSEQAAGAISLLPTMVGEPGEPARIELPLIAPEDVHETRRRRQGGETVLRRERVLKAGAPNGQAVLRVTAYN